MNGKKRVKKGEKKRKRERKRGREREKKKGEKKRKRERKRGREREKKKGEKKGEKATFQTDIPSLLVQLNRLSFSFFSFYFILSFSSFLLSLFSCEMLCSGSTFLLFNTLSLTFLTLSLSLAF